MRKNRLLASILVGAFVFLLAPVSARADDAASLLAKHKAFVGWSYGDGVVRTLSLQRQYATEKNVVLQTSAESRLGLAYRRDSRDTDGDGSTTGFTGNLFWTTSDNGFTVPIIGDPAKSYLIVDTLFMEGTSLLSATLQGPATVNGKSVQVVRVNMAGAFPMDVYVDPDTGAYVRAVVDPGGANEDTINIRSYTQIDASKKMIGSWSYGSDKGSYSYTKITLNTQVGGAQLHPPSAAATWNFSNSNPFPIKVTPDRIYVNATVNGVPGRFLLDTGAGNIVLTDKFATRAQVKTIKHSLASGIGQEGDTKTLIRKADTIVLGGNTLSNASVTTINESLDDKDYNETVDGLMGFDVFAGAIVNLKLSAQTMSLGDPATATVDRSIGFNVTPDLTSFTPQIPIRIGGKIDATALLDSGSTINIISKDVEKHGILMASDTEHTFLGGNAIIRGVGGDERVLCGQLSGISVGPIQYNGFTVCESAYRNLNTALLGFDFIKNFDYIFDYPHGLMVMTPIKQQ